MELATLNPELGEYFGTTEGLLVVRAPRADGLGLKSGDVILGIDGRTPSTPSQAMRILRSYEEGDPVQFQVLRQKKRTTVSGKIPAQEREFFRERHEEQ
jgi:S1-C subfamily serine protease